MTLVGICTAILTQEDKIVLSRLLPLDAFGYYTLAATLAAGLMLIVGPIVNLAFPAFTRAVASGDITKLRQSFRGATQLVGVLVLPAAAVLISRSHDLFGTWTSSNTTAMKVAPTAMVLIAGSALYAFWSISCYLQLAFGATAFGLKLAIGSIIALLPALLILAPRYGGIGAGLTWLILNVVHVTIAAPIIHRRLLPGSNSGWFLDTGKALGTVTVIGAILALAPTFSSSTIAGLAIASGGWILATLASLAAAPIIRRRILEVLVQDQHKGTA